MITPLWEWSVPRDAEGRSAGISRTRHGAMQALTKTLIQAGKPRCGQVAPVLLTHSLHDTPYYQRGQPAHTAVYDGQVLRWQ